VYQRNSLCFCAIKNPVKQHLAAKTGFSFPKSYGMKIQRINEYISKSLFYFHEENFGKFKAHFYQSDLGKIYKALTRTDRRMYLMIYTPSIILPHK
jgi:hypothetical protein